MTIVAEIILHFFLAGNCASLASHLRCFCKNYTTLELYQQLLAQILCISDSVSSLLNFIKVKIRGCPWIMKWIWGGGHRGADLNVFCKHFKKLKHNNFGWNCHFVDIKFIETFNWSFICPKKAISRKVCKFGCQSYFCKIVFNLFD